MKNEGVGLIVCAISFQDVLLIRQRYRQTDRDAQTACNRNTALCTIVHRAVKTTHTAYLTQTNTSFSISISIIIIIHRQHNDSNKQNA